MPTIINVEGQVVNGNEGKTFVRFNKDNENAWKVS